MSNHDYMHRTQGRELKSVIKQLRTDFKQDDSASPRSMSRREQRKLDREIARIAKHESEVNAARDAAEQRAEAAEQGLRAERERLQAQFSEALSSMQAELRERLIGLERVQHASSEEMIRRLRLVEESLVDRLGAVDKQFRQEIEQLRSEFEAARQSGPAQAEDRRFVPSSGGPPHLGS
jgi:hypothetical protein